MATDKSEPKIGNIVKVAVTGIVALVAIRIGLVTYFHNVIDTERNTKYVQMGKPQELHDLRSDEAKRLAGIDQSMQMLATKGRMEPGIEPQQPKAENAKDTLVGWMQMPKQGDQASEDGGGAPQPAMTGDGGAPAAMMADGGAMASDGGAAATPLDAGAAIPAPSTSGAHSPPAPSASIKHP
jgi:hypothetical protein